MQQEQIIPFVYENKKIRVTRDEKGEPWWVLADVCKVLDIGNPSDVKKRLHEDDIDTIEVIDNLSRKQIVTIINEFALYDVILMSRKPEARAFQYWITHEVLPAIRKTGTYILPGKKQWDSLRDITIKVLADETESAFRTFRKYAITGNEGRLEINATIRFRLDTDTTRYLGITELANDKTEEYLTPTELGKQIGCSAKKVNKLLLEKGLQTSFRDAKGELCYEPTEKGISFAVFGDSGKKQGKSTRKKRLLWKKSVIGLIS